MIPDHEKSVIYTSFIEAMNYKNSGRDQIIESICARLRYFYKIDISPEKLAESMVSVNHEGSVQLIKSAVRAIITCPSVGLMTWLSLHEITSIRNTILAVGLMSLASLYTEIRDIFKKHECAERAALIEWIKNNSQALGSQ